MLAGHPFAISNMTKKKAKKKIYYICIHISLMNDNHRRAFLSSTRHVRTNWPPSYAEIRPVEVRHDILLTLCHIVPLKYSQS